MMHVFQWPNYKVIFTSKKPCIRLKEIIIHPETLLNSYNANRSILEKQEELILKKQNFESSVLFADSPLRGPFYLFWGVYDE